jgi:ABC-type multidrug transport system ATPase subunit
MLEVLSISKSYNRKEVLRNVSFCLDPGKLTGIMGENGSGKSTLLKIIMGEIKADQGKVYVKGSIGYCPQEPLVFPTLTIEENFSYFASAYGITDKNKSKSVREALVHQLGLTAYLREQVHKLSGGTRQKLNLSISLLHDPDICVLDEPYGGFDMETYHHFWKIILQLKDQGKGILLVSHLLNDAGYFDHILTLQSGQLV